MGNDVPVGNSAPNELGGIPVINVNNSSLQRPGKHRLVRSVKLGGQEAGQDRRLYLHRRELEKLLEMANQSISGRVVLDMVGLKVELWSTPSGHQYETWTFEGIPKPERPSALDGLVG